MSLIALYGLCLQAFLGVLAPLPPASYGSALCAHEGENPSSDPVATCRHACCLPSHAGEVVLATATAFEEVSWPVWSAAPTMPRLTALGARAPPDPSGRPRGPPVV